MKAILLAVLLSGCAPVHWERVTDAIDHCMTLGEAPVKANGEIRCTGPDWPPEESKTPIERSPRR